MKKAIKENEFIKGTVWAWKRKKSGLIVPVFVDPGKTGFRKNNLTPALYRQHLAMKGSNTGSPPSDMILDYVSISTRFTQFTEDDGDISAISGGALELSRVSTTVTRTNETIYSSVTFGTGVGTTKAPNIDTVTSSTIFILDDATGLNVGDMVGTTVGSGYSRPEKRKITNIATNTVTINEAFSTDPNVNDTLYQYINGAILSYAGSASLNTGYAGSMVTMPTTKAADEYLIINHRIRFN